MISPNPIREETTIKRYINPGMYMLSSEARVEISNVEEYDLQLRTTDSNFFCVEGLRDLAELANTLADVMEENRRKSP